MNQAEPALVLAMVLGACSTINWAQPLPSLAAPNTLLSTSFATPLTYDAALARLGSYYEEQVGRKLPATLPEIAPH